MPASRIGIMMLLSMLLHLVVMKVPLPQQQDEVDEPLALVEPVPIKIEREEPVLDIATSSLPTEPKTESEKPTASPAATSPTPAAATQAPSQLQPEIEAKPVEEGQEAEGEAPPFQGEPPEGNEQDEETGGFQYSEQTGFAILDEDLQLPGSSACGNQEGCFQVDGNFRRTARNLKEFFDTRGYDLEEDAGAEETGLKVFTITNRDDPSDQQYLYVLSRSISAGPNEPPKSVAFYVVTQEEHTLAELNQKLD